MRVQIVEFRLADGRKIAAVVPAFIDAGDALIAIEEIVAFPPFEDESIRTQVFDQRAAQAPRAAEETP